MTIEERDKLYNKVYGEFIELLKGKIDKVVISEYEFYELNKTNYWEDTDGVVSYGIVRNNSYADVIKNTFENIGIKQEKDLITNNYIFRLESRK